MAARSTSNVDMFNHNLQQHQREKRSERNDKGQWPYQRVSCLCSRTSNRALMMSATGTTAAAAADDDVAAVVAAAVAAVTAQANKVQS